MKLSVVLVFVCAFCVVACAYPHHAFLDLPIAATLGDFGLTSLQIEFAGRKLALRIGRAIGQRIDVLAVITDQNPFSLEMRVLLLQDLGPLNVALDIASKEFRATVGLFLGPVRFDWGRAIGWRERRWGAVTVSPEQHLSLVLGLEYGGERISFLGGVRLFPMSGSWGISVLFREQRLTVAWGGYF